MKALSCRCRHLDRGHDPECELLNPDSFTPPSPEQIAKLRNQFGLTQAQAADIAISAKRSWAGWEGGESRMHPAIWAYVLIQLGVIKPSKFTPKAVLASRR
jgi:DNA-binding transcriptional regulator YiaG